MVEKTFILEAINFLQRESDNTKIRIIEKAAHKAALTFMSDT